MRVGVRKGTTNRCLMADPAARVALAHPQPGQGSVLRLTTVRDDADGRRRTSEQAPMCLHGIPMAVYGGLPPVQRYTESKR